MRGFRRSSGRVAAWLAIFGTVAMDTQAVPAAPPRPPAAASSPTDKAVSVVQTFMDQGQWSKAEGALHEVPDAGWQKVLRAQIHWKQGRVNEALKTLETFGGGSAKAERRQKLLLGEYRIGSGRRREGEVPLLDIIAEYNNDAITENDPEGLAVAGRAAHLLRSAKDANVLFNKSEQAGAPSVETLLWRGELFVEKYDPGHGEEVLKEALRLDAKRPDALAMLARLKLEQALDFDGAEKLADEALAVHPSHGPALAVKAGLALRDMELDRARGFLETGLKTNPKDLELLSLKAATQFLADDKAGFAKAKAEVLKVNPTYAQMYGIVGDLAEWEHRYDEVVAMMKEATRLDPDDARGWAQLGLTQLRSGAESEGLAALQTAWSKDKFNVRVYNTLNLYEKSIARDYEMKDGTVFRIRFAKAEKPVLERYVPKLLGEAWVSMKSRYGFVPPLPVQVDLFTTREQFSVRTSGLPNIGIQGVCFGKVIAAMSPKSESFNWGNVLWHELGHVFAIAASKSHVPRWFTEGLSEYETLVRRPEWRRSLDARFYLALRKGRLPGAVDMNRAFTHASDGFDVTVAYYAASQMIVFTAEEFGMARILDALERWGHGERTPAVLQKAFGVTPEQYDQRFAAWAKRKLARFDGQFLWEDDAKPLDKAEEEAKLHPKSADAQLDWAIALAQGRKMREAQQATDVALALDPKHFRAQFFAARLSASRQDWADQRAHLEALLQAGGDGYQVRMALASSAEKLKDRQAQRRHWEAAHRFDATESEPLRGLYDLAKEDHRDQDSLDILWRLAPLEQHDRQVWRLLLKGLVDAKDWPRARDVGSAAMYVDVLSAESHALYGKALAALGDHETAAFEFESASLCDKPAKESARIFALWARELLALGRVDEAKLRRDAALKEDPQCAEARSIDLP